MRSVCARWFATVLGCSAAWPGIVGAAAPIPIADVAFLDKGAQPWIAVDIGVHAGVHCIVDTGSPDAGVIGSDLARHAPYVRSMHVGTANGFVVVPVVRVGKVVVGNASVGGVEFSVRDTSWFNEGEPMPCVLGRNFLRRFTVDMDGHAGRLRLFSLGTRIDDIVGSQATHLDASLHEGGLMRTTVSVDGIPAEAVIDTGWALATPNQALLDRLGIGHDDPRIVDKVVKGSLSGRLSVLKTVELGQIRINSITWERPVVEVSGTDMVIRHQAGPYLHVGWVLLRAHRLLIDFRRRDVSLAP